LHPNKAPGIMKIFKLTFPLLLIVGIALFSITSCEEASIVSPQIISINLTPDTLLPGGSAQLKVNVNDIDDVDFVYYYSTTGGSIEGKGDSVTWIAPDKEGIYYASILVTDFDGNQASDSVRMVVTRSSSATLITGIAAFSSDTILDLKDANAYLYLSLNDMQNQVPFAAAKISGFGPIVSFRFDNVAPGNYYLGVWKDTDNGNTRNVGDYWGWYGTGTLLETNPPKPKLIELTEGSTLSPHVQVWVLKE